jgi:hypothetical protein
VYGLGPTRIVAARVPATCNNAQNVITPASVGSVTVEVRRSDDDDDDEDVY